MAEIILSAVVGALFNRLSSVQLLNIASKAGIGDKIKIWSKNLSRIRAVLSDAEEKQFTNQYVKIWLDDLQDLAYDLDDIVDELEFEILRRNLTSKFQASTSKSIKFFSNFRVSNFSTRAIMFNFRFGSKIDQISSRLEKISIDKFALDLEEENKIGGIKHNITLTRKRFSTSLVESSSVYGRKEDLDEIIKLLLEDEVNAGQIGVIPILGMGGVGKTTLAQLVFNDEKVLNFFDLKLWACVSDVFDVLGVTKTILMSLTSISCEEEDLNTHQVQLKELLSGKRFLLVLDDVWDHDYEEWDVLRRPFLAGAPGSRIIVTTRSANVAKTMTRVQAHHLKQLGEDHCLTLLARHALERENFEEHLDLKETGEKIVKKCQGLPLAVKALGGLLRTKAHRDQWEDVLNSEMWDLSGSVLPALQLSYHHLPPHLKRCFAYCAVFSKGYEFSGNELIYLWMAVGLLPPSNSRIQAEEFGCEYVDDLLSRSFFHRPSGTGIGWFGMHDLINDLAQLVAGKLCFRLDQKLQVSEGIRHLSYSINRFEKYQRFMDLKEVENFRTFFPLKDRRLGSCYLSNKVLADFLPRLKCLRVLSLRGYDIIELPNSIGELKLLRYLDLSQTLIKQLPEQVCTLYNLQNLSVSGCMNLYMLPTDFGDIINLRNLDNSDTKQLQAMPRGINKLTNLQSMPNFVVNRNSGAKLRELKDLVHLTGQLALLGLQDVMDSRDAEEANLRLKQSVYNLELQWCYPWGGTSNNNEAHEADVLRRLQPHRNLRSLKIVRYGGLKFANWIGDPSFSEVASISLINCTSCTSLPPLGQLPKLKHLKIRGMYQVRSVGIEFYNDDHSSEPPFKSLETLTFEDMPEWKTWSHVSGSEEVGAQFPCLRELTIMKCSKLIRIPLLNLPSLCRLWLEECHAVVLKSLIGLTSMTDLRIFGVTKLTYLPEEFLQLCVALVTLWLGGCPQFVSLWENGVALQSLVSLKEVRIWKCPQLVSLGEEEQGFLGNLEFLLLEDCDNLLKLPSGMSSLTSLRSLTIRRCPKLESLLHTGGLVSLKYLSIVSCEKLVYFPVETNIFPMLRGLTIKDCKAMEYLPNYESDISLLQELEVVNCSSLRWWPVGKSSPALKKIKINCCGNFVPSISSVVGSFTSLIELQISNCDGLKSFPEIGWASTSNLKTLHIQDCKNLVHFCLDKLQSLVSLDYLGIINCPNLISFPEGNLPHNLNKLGIKGCGELLKPLSVWGLHRLTSLEFLFIDVGYSELISLSDKNDNDNQPLLPQTLKLFHIRGFRNLESISKDLQNLTSLVMLIIEDCPKLLSLADENMLSNLSSLEIANCPLLKQRCLPKDKGEYWPMIASIPQVKIDGHSIYELSIG